MPMQNLSHLIEPIEVSFRNTNAESYRPSVTHNKQRMHVVHCVVRCLHLQYVPYA